MSSQGSNAAATRQDLALWAGLLAGPVAWAVQLQAVYALAMWACTRHSLIALHLTALVCLLLAGGGGWVAWRRWRAAGRGWPAEEGGVGAHVRFMAVLGMLADALFALVMVAQWVAVLLLDPCPV